MAKSTWLPKIFQFLTCASRRSRWRARTQGGARPVTSSEWVAFTETTSAADHEHATTTRHIVPLSLITTGAPDAYAHEFDISGPAAGRAVAGCTAILAADDRRDGSVNWSVRRRPTRWEVVGVFGAPGFEPEDFPTCALPSALTASMLGPDRVTVPWSAIKDVLPGAVLALESPTEDLLLVMQDSVWYAFFPRARATGPVVARFELHGTPVMTQWASGSHVARWTSLLTTMLEAGPPMLPNTTPARR